MTESIRIVPQGDIAFVEFDLVGESANKFNSDTMTRLKEVTEELRQSSYKAAVMVSKKKKIFIAGADIDEIKSINKKEDFMSVLSLAHEIFNAWESLPMPTLAAIKGACLGGGLEFSMCCDYRVASDDKSTVVGLPEVKLGIIPGFGGCVRLPRIVGLVDSFDMILAGKSWKPKKAVKKGLLDKVFPSDDFEAQVLKFAEEMAAGKKPKRNKRFKAKSLMDSVLNSFPGKLMAFSQARKTVLKQTKGFYPAPLKAIDVIEKTYGSNNLQRALLTETHAFCDVAVTDVSKHLISLFYLMEGIKKQTGVSNPDVKPLDVKNVGVLGAGVMGGGVAYVAADKGMRVLMKDITQDAIAKGFKAASDIWKKKMKRRRLTEFDYEKKMSLVSGALDFDNFKSLDVVVEAIVEDMGIKKKVIAETVKHCSPDCIIATNTSSLRVNEMATAHPNPEKFAGMHFFNPVDKMPLVEVIRGEKTSDETTATIFSLAKKMGKIPVVVKDGPGFLVNRLLLPLLSEALFFLEEGADIKSVDKYYTNEFGMPMGPFRLMDEVGLDVCVKVLKIFRESLGERIEVSDLTTKLNGTGRLGRKNSKGFYKYDSRGKETEVDESVYSDLGLKPPKGGLSSKECIERGILLMVNEASRALKEDHIVETAEECDLAMIMGTGFPPFRGGLLKYADTLGTEYIAQQLEEYAARLGIRFAPSESLIRMAKSKSTFY